MESSFPVSLFSILNSIYIQKNFFEIFLTFCPLPAVISGKRAKSFKTTLQMIYPNPLHLDN